MATHTIAAGEVRVTFTLAAGVVDTVTIAEPENATILTDGAASVDFTVDGSTPTVGGANTFPIPAAVCERDVTRAFNFDGTLKLISAGAPTLTVYRS